MQPTLYERIAILSEQCLIALGANLPWRGRSPETTLKAALVRLTDIGFTELHVSRFFTTPCFPPGAGPDYLNAAASARWSGSAQDALAALHTIEAEFGRERAQRWGMRTLDLDLIALGDQVLPDARIWNDWRSLPADDQRLRAPDQLILPHPRLQDRGFVLVPLADVAPDWQHPAGLGSVSQMLNALDPESLTEIRPLPERKGD